MELIQQLFLCIYLLAFGAPPEVIQKPVIDKIVVHKEKRQMQLLSKGKVIKEYRVSLGAHPIGAKVCQGDLKTPEGLYYIESRNQNSRFYKSLKISYPNKQDRQRAERNGVSLGGDIMIHGLGREFGFLGRLHLLRDWTLGCIAVTNEEIDEIYTLVPLKTAIEIYP